MIKFLYVIIIIAFLSGCDGTPGVPVVVENSSSKILQFNFKVYDLSVTDEYKLQPGESKIIIISPDAVNSAIKTQSKSSKPIGEISLWTADGKKQYQLCGYIIEHVYNKICGDASFYMIFMD